MSLYKSQNIIPAGYNSSSDEEDSDVFVEETISDQEAAENDRSDDEFLENYNPSRKYLVEHRQRRMGRNLWFQNLRIT